MKELKTARMEVSRNGEFVPIELFGTQGSDYNKELQAAKTEAFLLENRLRSLYSAADEIIYSTKADVKRYRDTVAEHASHTADDVWACTKMRDDAKAYADNAQNSYELVAQILDGAVSLEVMNQDIKILQEKVGVLEATYQNFEDRIKYLEEQMQVQPEAKDSYTIIFNSNNNGQSTQTMSDQIVLKDVPTRLNYNQYTYTGHTFVGWADGEFNSASYKDRDPVTNLIGVGQKKTLYAVWSYTIPTPAKLYVESREDDGLRTAGNDVQWNTPEITTSRTLEFDWDNVGSGVEFGVITGHYRFRYANGGKVFKEEQLFYLDNTSGSDKTRSGTVKINIEELQYDENKKLMLEFWVTAENLSSNIVWSARSALKISNIRMYQ